MPSIVWHAKIVNEKLIESMSYCFLHIYIFLTAMLSIFEITSINSYLLQNLIMHVLQPL